MSINNFKNKITLKCITMNCKSRDIFQEAMFKNVFGVKKAWFDALQINNYLCYIYYKYINILYFIYALSINS